MESSHSGTKQASHEAASGRIVLTMLEALACRGPDSAGIAMIGPEPERDGIDEWRVRIAQGDEHALERLATCGQLVPVEAGGVRERQAGTRCASDFGPRRASHPSIWSESSAPAEEAWKFSVWGGGSIWSSRSVRPPQLEATYGVSTWSGPLAIGHTRMSTESRIDLSHSQPFWAHGVPDLATVHNGHVTNYHQLAPPL